MHRHVYIQTFTHTHSGQTWMSVTIISTSCLHIYTYTYTHVNKHVESRAVSNRCGEPWVPWAIAIIRWRWPLLCLTSKQALYAGARVNSLLVTAHSRGIIVGWWASNKSGADTPYQVLKHHGWGLYKWLHFLGSGSSWEVSNKALLQKIPVVLSVFLPAGTKAWAISGRITMPDLKSFTTEQLW